MYIAVGAVPLRNSDYEFLFRKTKGEIQTFCFKLQNVWEKFNTEVLTKINIVDFKAKFQLEEKIA